MNRAQGQGNNLQIANSNGRRYMRLGINNLWATVSMEGVRKDSFQIVHRRFVGHKPAARCRRASRKIAAIVQAITMIAWNA